ncbi:hypothetical protein F5Y19DRAFT_478631 [Xylariaceae sp. FL1651]|nr:hypothetical protein F5Y19DRAFT_478631 [Xylariaceae sp. FL1651]
MSASPQDQSLAKKEKDSDEIDLFFDLDQASLPCFTTITDQKENSDEKWLTEALAHENNSGGNGPFVCSYSHAVFMGSTDISTERLDRSAEETTEDISPKPFPYYMNTVSC